MESKLLTVEIAASYWRSPVQSETPFKEVHERYLIEMGQGRCENDKLILTPLSEITEEHALGVSKAYGHNEPSAIQGLGLIDSCFIDYEDPNEITLQDGMRVTDYLRSVGYDCGHGSIPSLIEAGIAIKAEKKIIMAMRTLTAKIAANYLGCPVKTKEGITGVLVGVFAPYGTCNIELPDDSISVGHLLSDCQLMLMPISKILDKHAIELLKIASYYPQLASEWPNNIVSDIHVEKISRFTECIKIKHFFTCFEGYFLIGYLDNMRLHFEMQDENEEPIEDSIWQPHRLVDYLRSVGYDCGYSSHNSLIDLGIAIEL